MLLAKLAGEKTVCEIAQWVRLRAPWVQEQLPSRQLGQFIAIISWLW